MVAAVQPAPLVLAADVDLPIEIVDQRDFPYTILDNDVVLCFGAEIEATGLGLYWTLAQFTSGPTRPQAVVPSQAYLCTLTGFKSKETLGLWLDKLEEAGLIRQDTRVIEDPKTGTWRYTSTQYTLLPVPKGRPRLEPPPARGPNAARAVPKPPRPAIVPYPAPTPPPTSSMPLPSVAVAVPIPAPVRVPAPAPAPPPRPASVPEPPSAPPPRPAPVAVATPAAPPSGGIIVPLDWRPSPDVRASVAAKLEYLTDDDIESGTEQFCLHFHNPHDPKKAFASWEQVELRWRKWLREDQDRKRDKQARRGGVASRAHTPQWESHQPPDLIIPDVPAPRR